MTINKYSYFKFHSVTGQACLVQKWSVNYEGKTMLMFKCHKDIMDLGPYSPTVAVINAPQQAQYKAIVFL